MALLALVATPVAAQTQPTGPASAFDNIDQNGVDVFLGQFHFSMAEGTIGSGPAAVTLERYWGDGVWRDNWSGGVYEMTSGGVTTTYIDFGGTSASFDCSGGSCTSRQGDGATMVGSAGDYTYHSASGTTIQFQSTNGTILLSGYICPAAATNCGRPVSLTRADGVAFGINWTDVEKCPGFPADCGPKVFYRFAGVTSNGGYGFSVTYDSNSAGTYGGLPAKPPTAWYTRKGVTFFNSVTGACTVSICPSMAYSTSAPLTLTDGVGRVWRFTMTGANLTGIKRPGSASADTTTVVYSSGQVSQVTRNGVTTNYAYASPSTGLIVTTVTDAASNTVQIETDVSYGRPGKITDQLGHVTQQTYDGNARPLVTTWPESNTLTRAYDARGNVTSTTLAPKPSSSLSNIVTSATFPLSCTNPACNKPLTTTDARSHVTNYDYDTTTGQLTKVTLPAPTSGGVRPETRYGYAAVAAVSGTVSMPTTVSSCRTTASCAGGGDEVKTVIAYPTGTSPAHPLLPKTVTTGAGNGSLTATVAYTYTAAGDRSSVDGPLPGTDDTSNYFYDADRALTKAVGPDPDGAGALKNRATKWTYNADGQVTLAEQGTANPDGTSFVALQSVATTYDANARKTSDASLGGSTVYAVNQYSYDALGRPECVAQRMNSATWGTLTSACSLQTTGSSGPDRINKTTYDAASQVTKTTSAYLTADTADDATLWYSPNGKLTILADAKGYWTTYAYDGFDRLSETHYPSKTTPGTTSTTDWQAFLYDAASNLTYYTLRDGANVVPAYDNLNRRISISYPAAPNVTYSYDNLNRLLSASDTYSVAVTFTYDALGRVASDQSFSGTKMLQYDLAGRMTRLTWPDGFYIGYDHLVTGETSAILENGTTTVLATYGYDDLGRRTGVTRLNGQATTYGYDGVSRLTSLAHDFSGSTYDTTTTFSYNPASQIASSTRSNDLYAYTLANQDLTEAPNGLNQLTTQGSTNLSYDGRGNLTGVGATTYAYNSLNQLVGSSMLSSGGYNYNDPLGREVYIWPGSGNGHIFDWVGNMLVAENYVPGSDTVRRYVPGPGTDQYLLYYDQAGARRWLVQDERGSAIAIVNDSNAVTSINKYDDYGVPASGNVGSLGYTGQLWLSEFGLNSYKARMYAPGIGRFMQSDPIGYRAGMNLYAYVRGDPINWRDPWGLDRGQNTNGLDGCQFDTSGRLKCDEDEPAPITVNGHRDPGFVDPPPLQLDPSQLDDIRNDIPPAGSDSPTLGDMASFASAPTKKQSICTAVVAAATTTVSPELIRSGLAALRGASAAELLAEGAAAAAGSEVLLTLAVVGGVVYVADRVSGGKITDTLGDLVGCRKE